MQERLLLQLKIYIQENNPDLFLALQEENRVEDYLRENVASVDSIMDQLLNTNTSLSIIEELCMEELTKQLKPSRFNYLKMILDEEFPNHFERLQQHGLLTTELINMIIVCDAVFEEFDFSEVTEDDRQLRYAVIGEMQEYLSQETGVRDSSR